MNLSDYEAVWKRQPLPRGFVADSSELKATFETKRRKMAATLWVRDWIELLACGSAMVFYAQFWQEVGRAGWPMGGAILMVLFVAGVFIRERLRTRRHRLDADASLLAKISADLAELRHQRQLLRRVWQWYIAPCAIAVMLHAGVILRQAPPQDPVREPISVAVIAIFVGAVCWIVWIINRRAVRLRIEPRILELEKLQREVSSTE